MGRWLILPRYTQPEKDTKITSAKTQTAVAHSAAATNHCPSCGSRTCLLANRYQGFCSEDLSVAFIAFKALARLNCLELRKLG